MTAPSTAPPQQELTDARLDAAGMTVVDTPFVTVGGGLGSFALVDRLRVAGVPTDDITVISPNRTPDENFTALCHTSGLTDADPLRSDSSARMDNIWGFPGYAVEQAWRSRRPGPLLRVLGEPVLSEYFTPSVGQLRAGMHRESDRIGWSSMLVEGAALAVVKREGGGYFVVVRPTRGSAHVVYRCRFVHLALGYGDLRISAAAADFRNRGRDGDRVMHVYEPHDHVYEALAARGGTVIVRGAGIAASRVLQRIIDDRTASGQDVRIWHLFRHYQVRHVGPPWFRKRGGFGFSHQAFNFPKAAIGGQLWERTRRLDEDQRADLVSAMGGTTTPYRRAWARQLRTAREQGWYHAVVGEVSRFKRTSSGIAARIALGNGKPLTVPADFVIDATGVDAGAHLHPLLTDLVAYSGASVTGLGGLRVDADFAVCGTASGTGRIFTSGVLARGGCLAPVDSFAGLHKAAMGIADAMAERGFGNRLGPLRSLRGWARWMGGRQP